MSEDVALTLLSKYCQPSLELFIFSLSTKAYDRNVPNCFCIKMTFRALGILTVFGQLLFFFNSYSQFSDKMNTTSVN